MSERLLPTWEAQARIVPSAYIGLSGARQKLWDVLITSCVTPGIPIDHPGMRTQLAYIWGMSSVTYTNLIA